MAIDSGDLKSRHSTLLIKFPFHLGPRLTTTNKILLGNKYLLLNMIFLSLVSFTKKNIMEHTM